MRSPDSAKHSGIPGSRSVRLRALRAPRNDDGHFGDFRRLSGTDQRDRLVAFIEIQQAPQRLAALACQFRIVLQDPQRFVARLRDELRMDPPTARCGSRACRSDAFPVRRLRRAA